MVATPRQPGSPVEDRQREWSKRASCRASFGDMLIEPLRCRSRLGAGIAADRPVDAVVTEDTGDLAIGAGFALEIEFRRQMAKQMRMHLKPHVLQNRSADLDSEAAVILGPGSAAGEQPGVFWLSEVRSESLDEQVEQARRRFR